MSCSDCSFQSSGGDYPDGYCLWLLRFGQAHVCIACYCKDGYECQAPAPDRVPIFEGETIKVPCKKKP